MQADTHLKEGHQELLDINHRRAILHKVAMEALLRNKVAILHKAVMEALLLNKAVILHKAVMEVLLLKAAIPHKALPHKALPHKVLPHKVLPHKVLPHKAEAAAVVVGPNSNKEVPCIELLVSLSLMLLYEHCVDIVLML
jgi:hypothetical protein